MIKRDEERRKAKDRILFAQVQEAEAKARKAQAEAQIVKLQVEELEMRLHPVQMVK